MKYISFAYTLPALLTEPPRKTVTRRAWASTHRRLFHKGDLVHAYNKDPRGGGHAVAVIELTQEPYDEPLCRVPDSDWEAEGFAYLESIGALVDGITPRALWREWKSSPPDDEHTLTVIRFKRVQVL